jgi:hypothetical protein
MTGRALAWTGRSAPKMDTLRQVADGTGVP